MRLLGTNAQNCLPRGVPFRRLMLRATRKRAAFKEGLPLEQQLRSAVWYNMHKRGLRPLQAAWEWYASLSADLRESAQPVLLAWKERNKEAL